MRVCLIVVIILFSIIVVPSRAQVAAHVQATTGQSTWSYIIFNDEPVGSPNYLGFFTLLVNAPVTVVGTPEGWDFQTDGNSFVLWFNTDLQLPYPHDVAPGDSLAGFGIQSSSSSSSLHVFDLESWDHSDDVPGPGVNGLVLAPGLSSTAPEPGSLNLIGMLAVAAGILATRRFAIKARR